MKKQINPTIKAHLVRSAFYVILLLAVCVIPFALAQRNTTKGSAGKSPAAIARKAQLAAGHAKPAGQATKAPPPSGAMARTMLSGKATSAKRLPQAPNLSPWSIVANYPFASESVSCSSDGTFGYCVGGFDPNIGPTASFNRYDPVADTWTPLTSIPTGFYDAPSVYAPNTNTIYVFGGIDTTFTVRDIVQRYDVASGTWIANGTPMPDPAGRYFAAAAYDSTTGLIYVMGGFDGFTFSEQTNNWIYDPVTDTWDSITGAPIPVAMGGAGYSIVGDNVYLAGHWNGGLASTDHYRYDVLANSWTAMAPVPTAIYRPDAAGIGTNTYLVGGGNPSIAPGRVKARGPKMPHPSMRSPATSFTSTYIYDTLTDSWTSGPNTNVAHSFTGGTAIGTKLIVVTGFDGVTGDTNIVEAADAAGPCVDPIVNGGFETGDFTGWVATGDVLPVVSTNQAHSGTFSAFAGDSTDGFCGFPGTEQPGDSIFYQQFTVPAAGGTLSFWYWTCTTDNINFDWQDAYITDTSGNILQTIFHQCVDNEFWVNQTVDMSPYAGQDVRIEYLVHTDDFGDLTGMYVDDVTMCAAGPTPSPTPTPSGTPICAPGPWQEVAPMTTDLYGAAGASDGTNFYAAGGYSFSQGFTLNILQKYDGTSWTTLSPMPQSAALGCGVYDPANNKFYVFGGEDAASGQNYNLTQIYDIASDTWSNGANMPDVHSFEACGYNPGDGMIYVLSGYNTGDVTSAQPNTWQYDPVADSWTDLTGTDPYPHPAGGFGYGVINNKLYTAGGRDAANTIINDTWEFDPAAPAGSRYTQKSDEPGTFQNNVPGSAAAQGVLWVYGGGNPFVADAPETKAGITAPTSARVAQTKRSFPLEFLKRLFGHKPNAPDTDNSGRFYDPISDSWSNSPNMNEVRSFTSGAAIGNNLIIAAGGYNGFGTVSSAETENVCAGGGVTPTPTPTVSPTCPPGSPNGAAGPWIAGNPYPTTIVRYGFAQTATHFYVFGGVDNGSTTNAVNRMDLSTGNWEPRAPMPFSGEAPTCALDASSNIVYCADGNATNSFAAYDIAADSWTPLAPDPLADNHYGSASGAFNGKVFVAGGFIFGGASAQVDVYDIASNTWSSGTAAPAVFFLAGYQQIGQFLYVVGGFEPSFNNNATTWRLDLSTGTWDVGPAFTPQLADFGLAYDAGTNKVYSLGGDLPNDGNPFNSTNQVNELDLSAWPGGTWNPSPPDLPAPNRQAAQAGFYGNSDIWCVGGINGATFQFLNEVWHRNNGGAVCPSPTPTPTPTITPTPSIPPVTPTPTPSVPPVTPTPSVPPVTPTPTPTETPRQTPTPRPRPTPHPRPPH